MKAGEGTDHENSGSETLPESIESDLSIDLLDLGKGAAISSLSLVEDGDHGVSWMGNEGAEHTGNVTGHESNHKLSSLAIGVLWRSENRAVEFLHNLLESHELHNGVWNLSGPEWLETLIEASVTLGGLNLLESGDGGGWEFSLVGGLHFDLQL